jgi:hypothetical protein
MYLQTNELFRFQHSKSIKGTYVILEVLKEVKVKVNAFCDVTSPTIIMFERSLLHPSGLIMFVAYTTFKQFKLQLCKPDC